MRETVVLSDVANANDAINTLEYPTYAKDIINLSNRYGQGTRKNQVGQLSELIEVFRADSNVHDHSVGSWKQWHEERYPDALDKATEKAWRVLQGIAQVAPTITEEQVKEWIKDLLYYKTYNGLMAQKAILEKISSNLNLPLTPASPEDESQGIDGYINGKPVQIKPRSFEENIIHVNDRYNCVVIIYDKSDDSFTFDYNPEDFQ